MMRCSHDMIGIAFMWLSLLLAAAPPTPDEALARLDSAAKVLETVQYGATRVTETGEQTHRETWRYASEPGGRFRIDYFGETQRQIASDGKVLTEYVPARRQARRYDLSALDPDKRAEVLGGILGKVSLPGVRSGVQAATEMAELSWGDPTERNGRTLLTIIGTGEQAGDLAYTIDQEHGYLVTAEIRQQSEFVVRTESRQHREVAPGFWLPTEVTSIAPGPGGSVRVDLRLNGVVVGEDANDDLFTIDLDPSVDVVEIP